jgi:ribosome-associated protein
VPVRRTKEARSAGGKTPAGLAKPKARPPERPAVPALSGEARAIAAVLAALEAGKAELPVHLNVAGRTSFTDHLVIATGTNPRHVAALADRVEAALGKHKVQVLQVEGLPLAQWVVVDAGWVVVHVFEAEARVLYNLEKLWGYDF